MKYANENWEEEHCSFHKIETEIMKAIQIRTKGSTFHTTDEDKLVSTFEWEKTGYMEANP